MSASRIWDVSRLLAIPIVSARARKAPNDLDVD